MRPSWIWLALFVLAGCHEPETHPASSASQDRIVIGAAPPSKPIAPKPVAAPKEQASSPTEETVVDRLRDPRLRRASRSLPLLIAEVAQLNSLAGATNKSSPDRILILRRMADSYGEIARAARKERSSKEATMDASRAAQLQATETNAWLKATKTYEECLQLAGQGPRADEDTYHLALSQENSQQMDQARKSYLQLIINFPTSKLIPAAFLAFGEAFFREMVADPSKMELARQSYNKVVEYPPPDNKVYELALVRLAQIEATLGGGEHKAMDRANQALDLMLDQIDRNELRKLLPAAE